MMNEKRLNLSIGEISYERDGDAMLIHCGKCGQKERVEKWEQGEKAERFILQIFNKNEKHYASCSCGYQAEKPTHSRF
jgi:hypothetical protein